MTAIDRRHVTLDVDVAKCEEATPIAQVRDMVAEPGLLGLEAQALIDAAHRQVGWRASRADGRWKLCDGRLPL
jgi:hypothetical protein